jgi:hypothetical protein
MPRFIPFGSSPEFWSAALGRPRDGPRHVAMIGPQSCNAPTPSNLGSRACRTSCVRPRSSYDFTAGVRGVSFCREWLWHGKNTGLFSSLRKAHGIKLLSTSQHRSKRFMLTWQCTNKFLSRLQRLPILKPVCNASGMLTAAAQEYKYPCLTRTFCVLPRHITTSANKCQRRGPPARAEPSNTFLVLVEGSG